MSENDLKYFEEHKDYPGDVCENPLPWNVQYNYIGRPFLDAFIPYCSVIKAFVLNRYYLRDDKKHFENRSIKKFTTPPLHLFGDDIQILGKITGGYMFFYYDLDVSDCSIGRFRTNDNQEQVVNEFLRISGNSAIEIPASYFMSYE